MTEAVHSIGRGHRGAWRREVRDANFRIDDGRRRHPHLQQQGHAVAEDAFALFAGLGVENDGAHAFYLGAELTKAEIAWQLGKRYSQDEPLAWGAAARRPDDDRTRLAKAGHTLAREEGALAMPYIRETIVTTVSGEGEVHIAPLRHHRRGRAAGSSPRSGRR